MEKAVTKKFQSCILYWSNKNLRDFPWRKKNVTPFKILVAEMLLKRTTAKAASKVYPDLIRKYTSVRKLSVANKKQLAKFVAPIGYPQRAGEMIMAAEYIVENFGGKIPSDKKSLLSIPYVGDYTSSAILSLGYGVPSSMVDSNVSRIISRVFIGKNPQPHITKEVKQTASRLLHKGEHQKFNFAMLDIGGTICIPRDPKCKSCPLSKLCKYNETRN